MFDITEIIYKCASKDWINHLTTGGSYTYQLLLGIFVYMILTKTVIVFLNSANCLSV
jgi:hypothetical protein